MSLWWQHRSFLPLLTLPRRTTNNYSWSRHHYENPRTQGWGWAPLHHRHQETSLEGKRSGYTLITLPIPQAGAALCWELPPEPMTPPVGKRAQENIQPAPSVVGRFLGALTLTSLHRDFRRIFRDQPLGIWPWQRNWVGGRGLQQENLDLGSSSSYLQNLSSSASQQFCSTAETKFLLQSDQGNGWVQVCLIQVLK